MPTFTTLRAALVLRADDLAQQARILMAGWETLPTKVTLGSHLTVESTRGLRSVRLTPATLPTAPVDYPFLLRLLDSAHTSSLHIHILPDTIAIEGIALEPPFPLDIPVDPIDHETLTATLASPPVLTTRGADWASLSTAPHTTVHIHILDGISTPLLDVFTTVPRERNGQTYPWTGTLDPCEELFLTFTRYDLAPLDHVEPDTSVTLRIEPDSNLTVISAGYMTLALPTSRA